MVVIHIARLILLVCLLVAPLRAAEVAIIIDDMGNGLEDHKAFSLPVEITFSILPHAPYSTRFAREAAMQNREVMLHMPMESLRGRRLGPGALTAEMDAEHVQMTIESALASVPNAIGLNNHMGSKLTQLTLPMSITMDVLKRNGLVFVDSRTTRYTKAQSIADAYGVPNARRHVFLDHHRDEARIREQVRTLVNRAKKYGSALGIGHPYPQTVNILMEELASLSDQNVTLVNISDYLDLQDDVTRPYQVANQSRLSAPQ